jgi:regulator of protease activity HflC (stomatin/prohibitin superfamily)
VSLALSLLRHWRVILPALAVFALLWAAWGYVKRVEDAAYERGRADCQARVEEATQEANEALDEAGARAANAQRQIAEMEDANDALAIQLAEERGRDPMGADPLCVSPDGVRRIERAIAGPGTP